MKTPQDYFNLKYGICDEAVVKYLEQVFPSYNSKQDFTHYIHYTNHTPVGISFLGRDKTDIVLPVVVSVHEGRSVYTVDFKSIAPLSLQDFTVAASAIMHLADVVQTAYPLAKDMQLFTLDEYELALPSCELSETERELIFNYIAKPYALNYYKTSTDLHEGKYYSRFVRSKGNYLVTKERFNNHLKP